MTVRRSQTGLYQPRPWPTPRLPPTRTKWLFMKMIYHVPLKSHGKAIAPTIIVFTPVQVISRTRSSTMVYLETLVSAHDRRSFSLLLTLILVVPTSGHIAPERLHPDFAFLIPLECKTSTPVAPRRQKISPDQGAAAGSSVLVLNTCPMG